jgi:hypothetical protein
MNISHSNYFLARQGWRATLVSWFSAAKAATINEI